MSMREIRVLGICGSPRAGNSLFLLREALASAETVPGIAKGSQSLSVRGKKLAPCIACGRCYERGDCCLEDDFSAMRDAWLAADAIIYSVPVYHMSIPGQLKCFIDRLGNSLFGRYRGLFTEDKLPKFLKAIGNIAQGVHLHSGQEHAITDLINHALLMGCVPVTGDLWQAYIGGAGWTSNDGEPRALERQCAERLPDALVALASARSVGRRTAEMALLLRAGAEGLDRSAGGDPIYRVFLAASPRSAGSTP
jgi:multimeric flavodoxin WrbA